MIQVRTPCVNWLEFHDISENTNLVIGCNFKIETGIS
uniref:Uncharacterized protein n=1 Tax=Rhizophora mucronata TaxID=61149 RepID=A0A2P2PHI3_RHIMU